NKYRRPKNRPCRAHRVAKSDFGTDVPSEKVIAEAGKNHNSEEMPQRPACHHRSSGNPRVVPKFLEKVYRNGFEGLTPVPQCAAVLPILFLKISEDHVVVGAASKTFQQPRWNSWSVLRRHAFSPFSSGRPSHRFIRDFRASRTSRSPDPVTRK